MAKSRVQQSPQSKTKGIYVAGIPNLRLTLLPLPFTPALLRETQKFLSVLHDYNHPDYTLRVCGPLPSPGLRLELELHDKVTAPWMGNMADPFDKETGLDYL